MSRLDWFFAITTLVALICSFLVYRHDRKAERERKDEHHKD
jgi:preprotein translocase subunit YajC